MTSDQHGRSRAKRLLIIVTIVMLTAALGLVVLGRVALIGPFAPEAWRSTDGRVSPLGDIGVIHTTDEPFDYRGPAHCNLNGFIFVNYANGSFVEADTSAVKGEPSHSAFSRTARRPADAAYTGWHKHDRQIWVSPAEKATLASRPTYDAVYIVFGDHTERWPRWDWGCE